MSSSLLRGASAGTLGTLALGGFTLLRNAALGHAPPYSARRISARLVGRVLHRRVSPREALFWSLGQRWLYGSTLGLAWTRVRSALRLSTLSRGLVLGAGVWTFEQITFPLLRATRPPRTWSRAEHGFLVAQTFLFGLVTECSLAVLERRRHAPDRPAVPEPRGEPLTSEPSPGQREAAARSAHRDEAP